MKKLLPFLTLLLLFAFTAGFAVQSWAQIPVNDSCAGAINIPLGANSTAINVVGTNLNATGPVVAPPLNPVLATNPPSWGANTSRDVWYTFTTDATHLDLTFSVSLIPGSPCGNPNFHPQIAIYRGACDSLATASGLDVLVDASSASLPIAGGQHTVSVDGIGLTPNTTYYIRVNDWSATGTPTWGCYGINIHPYCFPALMPTSGATSITTSACCGTLHDSGGYGPYSPSENGTFTISPGTSCVTFYLDSLDIENNFDFIYFYDGPTTASPLIGTYTGTNYTCSKTIVASSGTLTIQFISDNVVQQSGFVGHWDCNAACAIPPPPPGSNCSNAIVIPPVHYGVANTYTASGNTCGSGNDITPTACGNSAYLNGEDYVFVFTPDSTGCYDIKLTGTQTNTGLFLFQGCPTGTPAGACVNSSASTANNPTLGSQTLIQGNTYYIVIDRNTSASTTFNLIITQITCPCQQGINGNTTTQATDYTWGNGPTTTPTNNACLPCTSILSQNVSNLVCSFDGYCGTTSACFNNEGTTNLPFCGSIDNNSWLVFTASSTAAKIIVKGQGCKCGSSLVQFALYQGTNAYGNTGPPTGLSPLPLPAAYASNPLYSANNCWGGGINVTAGASTPVNFAGMVPCQTYYLMIDGFAGSVCNFAVVADSGWNIPVLKPTFKVLNGTGVVCRGDSNSIAVEASSGCNNSSTSYTYSWAPNPSITSTSLTGKTISFVLSGVSTTYTCTVTGLCGSSNSKVLSLVVKADTALAGPVINCGLATINSLIYNWVGNPLVTSGYQVSLDSVALAHSLPGTYIAPVFAPNNSSTSHLLTGLLSGSNYTFYVKGNNACGGYISKVTCPTVPCSLVINPQVLQPTCGFNNGRIDVNASAGSSAYTYKWKDNTGTPFAGPSIRSNLPSGSYYVTCTDQSTGCATTAHVVLNPSSVPVATAQSSSTTCGLQNGVIAVNVTPSAPATGSYAVAWSANANAPSPAPLLLTGLAAGVYSCTVTAPGGCKSIISGVINPSVPISISITGTPAPCNQPLGTIALTVNASNGNAVPTWAATNPTAIPAGQLTGSLLVGGNYVVTVTDAQGCVASTSYNISSSVNLAAPTVACGAVTGNTVTMSWSGTPAATSYEVSTTGASGPWVTPSSGNTPTSFTHTYTFTPGSVPVLYVRATIGGAAGCVSPAAASACVCSIGVSLAQVTASTCSSANGAATATVTGAEGVTNYTWSGTAASTTANAGGIGAGVYTVTVTDAWGCSKTASKTMTTTPVGTVSISAVQPTCGGQNGVLVANVTNPNNPVTFLWNGGVSGRTYTNAFPGTYVVTVTDGTGCITTATAVLNPSVGAKITLQATDPSCGLSNGVLKATGSGGGGKYTYLWNGGVPDSVRTNVAAGTYCVTLTDKTGCTSTACVTLNNSPNLNANIAAQQPTCQKGGTLSGEALGGSPAFTYTWSDSTSVVTKDRNNVPAGTYTVTITDAKGCVASASVTLVPPKAFNIDSIKVKNTQCHGDANGEIHVFISGGSTKVDFGWSDGVHGYYFKDRVGLSANSYNLTITDDSTQCTITRLIPVGQPAALSTDAYADSTTCFGNTDGKVCAGALTGFSTKVKFAWSVNNATTSCVMGLPIGAYTVTVTDDSTHCATTQTVVVKQPDQLTVDAGPNQTIYVGQTATFNAQLTGGTPVVGANYTWTTKVGSPSGTGNPFSAHPTAPGTYKYTIVVKNAKNCTATDSLTLIVNPQGTILVPNMFTPNGDGHNDTFYPFQDGSIVVESFRVVNRWGDLMHDDPTKGWDGAFQGQQQPMDTYIYTYRIRKYDGTIEEKSGDVTLLR